MLKFVITDEHVGCTQLHFYHCTNVPLLWRGQKVNSGISCLASKILNVIKAWPITCIYV